MVSVILRGLGDSRNLLLFVVIAPVINIIRDILFIGGAYYLTGNWKGKKAI